jgi:hypothetical protein
MSAHGDASSSNVRASCDPSGQSYGHPSQNSTLCYVNGGAMPIPTECPPNAQLYSTHVGMEPGQGAGHHTLPPTRYPYRPRPSPTPSGEDRDYTFCEHGASFDCGYGCHAKASQHTPPSQYSPGSHSSPFSSHPGTPNSSSLTPPPGTQFSSPGTSGYAILPSRMAPCPSMNVADQKFTSPDSMTFTTAPGVHVLPSGQPARYASLPYRVARGPNADSTSDATQKSPRRE